MNMYEAHELANIFPLIEGDEFDKLVDDIKTNGLLNPIVLYEGKILDGRNRFNACLEAGIQPLFVEYDGDSPLNHVVSLNLTRRHLSESQRALVGAKLSTIKHGGNRQDVDLRLETSIDDASQLLNISPSSIDKAKRVLKLAPQEDIEAIEKGEMTVNRAVNNLIVTKYTGNEEWYTPKKYIDMAREVLGRIDIDPASNPFANQVVQATTYYTKEDDGLTKEWRGKMWLNPPYSSIIAEFINKTCNSDVEAIVLTNNSTDTKWFAQAANNCDAICFTYGRINFYDDTDKKSSPTNGQAFFYFGDNVNKFNQVFKEIGFVVKVI
jgi:phage N-6-adenine-methyltransferase